MELIAIGNRIRSIREERGMTQEQLSLASGLSIKHISAMERGIKNSRISTILSVSEALGVTPNDLLLEASLDSDVESIIRNKLSTIPVEKQKRLVKVIDTLVDTL